MVIIDIIYNVVEEYKNDITDIKEIINKKMYEIIKMMEFNVNYYFRLDDNSYE